MSDPLDSAQWWVRGPFIVVGLAGWYWTQSLVSRRTSIVGSHTTKENAVGDFGLVLLAAPHRYLATHRAAANALLISSSAIIDVLGGFLLAVSVFGPTIRPFLALLIVFALRQICQLICALPPPPGMIWRSPGFPSLLVTYHVANDFFFSGHTGLAVLGAIELMRFGGEPWLPAGVAIIVFECLAVLVLRAHYTIDVLAGAIIAHYAAILAADWAPWCDALLARVAQ
jgi:hypothetical protein